MGLENLEFNIDERDSKEEVYFEWFLKELKHYGFIKSYLPQPRDFKLFDKVKYDYHEVLKTKVNVKKRELMRAHIYTPDYFVVWDEKAEGVFYEPFEKIMNVDIPFKATRSKNNKDEYFSIIETKGTHDFNNMTRLFRLNQKWLYAEYGMYVELIKIPTIFKKTFVPARYIRQDKRNGKRKINFKVTTIEEFVNRYGK